MELSKYKGDFIHFKCEDIFSGMCRSEDLITILLNLCETVEKLHKVELRGCGEEEDPLTSDSYTKPSNEVLFFSKIDLILLEKLIICNQQYKN